MAIRSLSSKAKTLRSLFNSLQNPKTSLLSPDSTHHLRLFSSSPTPQPSQSSCSDPPSPDLVNEISRVLSDFRNPHHDLELSLAPFSSKLSTNLVEQVLKRCRNLGFSAHRFFIWAKSNPGFQHSVESYHILVDVLGSSKQFAFLWDFLIEIREGKCFEIGPEIFWIVFRAYSRAHLPEDAIRAFSRMVEFGVKPRVDDLDQLLFELCKRKHMRHAQDFFDRVKSEFVLSAKTYSILMRGWGDIGDCEEARKLFDEMLERGCVVDVQAYNSLLEALCKGGKGDEAYEIFRKMGSNGVDPDACTYALFIRAYCAVNDIHSVFRVLDTMARYNLFPNVFTYNCIIKKLCKNERVGEAYQLLDEMIERGVIPDEWSYNAILAYHCEHTEVNGALKLISRMEKDKCKPDRHTFNMALKLLVRVGRFDRATELWDSMGKRGFYPSVSTYSVMVHSLIKKKGKLEEARKYFEMMIDDGIPPYLTTVELLRNRLSGLRFSEDIHILADKMEQSTSCAIQELAAAMRGKKVYGQSRSEETDFESE